ncbi:hypothetical protein ASPCADRAFT_7009 [Aspergillus carbonarius ITEM 5010]|uniref:Uncharacterized protein n=1 Tax=Aspergillus carbonarius (strain ITEM 5010) TaxID=602072 RepID=A0A1R3RIK6_ASPC5|nr:hypothetical protein ASPCADRAFT_7009 [Aspergillus carbonarius ITEM 5010]
MNGHVSTPYGIMDKLRLFECGEPPATLETQETGKGTGLEARTAIGEGTNFATVTVVADPRRADLTTTSLCGRRHRVLSHLPTTTLVNTAIFPLAPSPLVAPLAIHIRNPTLVGSSTVIAHPYPLITLARSRAIFSRLKERLIETLVETTRHPRLLPPSVKGHEVLLPASLTNIPTGRVTATHPPILPTTWIGACHPTGEAVLQPGVGLVEDRPPDEGERGVSPLVDVHYLHDQGAPGLPSVAENLTRTLDDAFIALFQKTSLKTDPAIDHYRVIQRSRVIQECLQIHAAIPWTIQR